MIAITYHRISQHKSTEYTEFKTEVAILKNVKLIKIHRQYYSLLLLLLREIVICKKKNKNRAKCTY